MRFGLTTPIVTLVPGRHGEWERQATIETLRQVIVTADRLGYAHATCSDHVAIPEGVAATRGARYYDPFATLGFFAAITTRLHLVTHVLVLPYHHPLELAKRLGTLDQLSGGRVVAGVGVGSLREEFELLGVDFDARGARFEEGLRALRVALDDPAPVFEGAHYRFGGFVVDPCATRRVPIWIGGRTPRSLRRALRYADGWDPFGLTRDQLTELLSQARRWPEWDSRPIPFEIVLAPERPLTLGTTEDIGRAIDAVAAYEKLGATALNLQFRARTLEEWQEQAAVFIDKVARRWSGAGSAS